MILFTETPQDRSLKSKTPRPKERGALLHGGVIVDLARMVVHGDAIDFELHRGADEDDRIITVTGGTDDSAFSLRVALVDGSSLATRPMVHVHALTGNVLTGRKRGAPKVDVVTTVGVVAHAAMDRIRLDGDARLAAASVTPALDDTGCVIEPEA